LYVEQRDRRAEVPEHLVLDDGRLLLPVAAVEDQRLVRVVVHEARGEAEVAAHIERVEGEPLAAAIRRIEAVDAEADGPIGLEILGLGEARRGGGGERGEESTR
jgi:hypothetical protein